MDIKREVITIKKSELPAPKSVIDKTEFANLAITYNDWVRNTASLPDDEPALVFRGISPSTARQSALEYNTTVLDSRTTKLKDKDGNIIEFKTRQRRTEKYGEVLYVYFGKKE